MNGSPALHLIVSLNLEMVVMRVILKKWQHILSADAKHRLL